MPAPFPRQAPVGFLAAPSAAIAPRTRFQSYRARGGDAASAAAAACGELGANHHSHPNLVYTSCLIITLPVALSLVPALQIPQRPAAPCAPVHRTLQRRGKSRGGRSLSAGGSSGRQGSLSQQRLGCSCSGSALQLLWGHPRPDRTRLRGSLDELGCGGDHFPSVTEGLDQRVDRLKSHLKPF